MTTLRTIRRSMIKIEKDWLSRRRYIGVKAEASMEHFNKLLGGIRWDLIWCDQNKKLSMSYKIGVVHHAQGVMGQIEEYFKVL